MPHPEQVTAPEEVRLDDASRAADLRRAASAAETALLHRPRLLQYDILRLMAMFGVVLIHVTATAMGSGPGNVAGAPLWLLRPNQLVRWAVPAFAFLTGSLMWTRHIPLHTKDLVSFFRRRFLVVVVPYLLWAATYFVIGRKIGQGPSAKLPAGLWPRLVVAFDLVVQGKVWYHLYFIPVVLMLYAVAPAVSPLARRLPWLLAGVSVAASVLLVDVVTRYVVNHANIRELSLLLLIYVPYAAFGAWYAVDRERWDRWLTKVWPLLLAVGVGLHWAEVSGRLTRMSPVASREFRIAYMQLTILGLLGLAVAVTPLLHRRGRSLADASRWSYGVYLSHPLLITAAQAVLATAGLAGLWHAPSFVYGAVVVVTGAAFALSAVLHRSRLTSWLV